MRSSQTQYDRISSIYAPLSNFISGGGNSRSKKIFLSEVEDGKSLLVVGCGSVDFPVETAKKGCIVTCLDISEKMLTVLEKKAKRAGVNENMKFICSDIMDFNNNGGYDYVSANFFLNVFEPSIMEDVFRRVISFIKPGGKFFLADEVQVDHGRMKWLQRVARPFVYYCHHFLVNNPIHDIYDYKTIIEKHNLKIVIREIDKSQFIQSIVAQKTTKK